MADDLPTFSGGLGVLAGDHLRAAADLGLPIVGVTLVYHAGFFRQTLDAEGRQIEHEVRWSPAEHLERLDEEVEVVLSGRHVTVGVWRLRVTGIGGHHVPLYLLDTRVAGNDPADEGITDHLYTGDPELRLAQEAVLGLGGTAMLATLGHDIETFHMNEGHAALVPVGLLARDATTGSPSPAEVEAVRKRCVFTTHTPVPAGHDRFSRSVVESVLGVALAETLEHQHCFEDDQLNMTTLGMSFAGFINGVARRHASVSQAMFPRFTVRSITNGVHAGTWTAPSTQRLFDHHVPGWREDNAMLRYAMSIPVPVLREAHTEAKGVMLDEIARRSGRQLDPAAFTIGVARRAAAYKRNHLLLSQPDQLRKLASEVGPIQVVYSGKAHPMDEPGKGVIAQVVAGARELAGAVSVVYLEDYGMDLAGLLCSGVDLWLNTPMAPHEASGTSGMKAALNGVPSLSILDGWWIEGHIEGVTGWAIGADPKDRQLAPTGNPAVDATDATELYRMLQAVVAPLYYHDPDGFWAVGRGAMALNGSFFTTQRMVSEYAARAYGHGSETGVQ